MNTAPVCEMSLNRRINEWKENAKQAHRRATVAETERDKAEAAVRSLTRGHAFEKARADRAEAQLRSMGLQIGATA